MNIHQEEYIGKEIEIITSNNKSQTGICGKIIDETKKTFKIRTSQSEEKTILKNGCTFKINGKNIDGKNIMQRPEERIKQRR